MNCRRLHNKQIANLDQTHAFWPQVRILLCSLFFPSLSTNPSFAGYSPSLLILPSSGLRYHATELSCCQDAWSQFLIHKICETNPVLFYIISLMEIRYAEIDK